MTVCVAALAARSRALVCIADKSVAYGEKIQWDSDSTKLFHLKPSGAVVMFSGCERDITEVLSRILEVEEQLGTDKRETRELLQDKCKEAADFLIDRLFLSPNQFTREEYVAAKSGPQINPYVRELTESIKNFELDCQLLVCGFEDTSPFILSLDPQGIVTDLTSVGCGSIGAGWEYATARLLFSEHERDHDIHRVLFDVFDAKTNAEMALYVGYEWDAWIVFPGKMGTHEVPKDTKKILEDGWADSVRSPFEAHDPNKHANLPPADWKEQLQSWGESLIVKQVSKNKSAAGG